jgi:REP element-mobilizing transposase RayT
MTATIAQRVQAGSGRGSRLSPEPGLVRRHQRLAGKARCRRASASKPRLEGRQALLPFPNTWGGKRRGAGRRRTAERAAVPHRCRPAHAGTVPVHVTLRVLLRSLRSQFVFPTVRGVIADANRRNCGRFRIVHFSVQADHVHLIVEATNRHALSRGLSGFSVSLARRVNRLLFRHGRFLAERWHERALAHPRAVRHALVYVLGNCKKHGQPNVVVDHCSSAPYFRFFAGLEGQAPIEINPRLVPQPFRARATLPPEPATWLLRLGWLRHGLLSLHEHPRTR